MSGRWSLFDGRGERKYLNASERDAFFDAVCSCMEASPKAFCLTLFYTGCRISEALELTAERIDFAEGSIVFRTLKRRDAGKFRVVPIPPSLVALLKEVAQGTSPHTRKLWATSRVSGYRLIKRYMALAGLDGIKACPKGLRHGFAVACVSHGVPITTLQRWMGHARLETTAIYLDMMGEEDRQQAAKIWKEE